VKEAIAMVEKKTTTAPELPKRTSFGNFVAFPPMSPTSSFAASTMTEEALADIIAPNCNAEGQRVVRPAEVDVRMAEAALAAASLAGIAAPVLEKAKTAILAAKEAQTLEENLAEVIAPNRDAQGQRVVRPAELDIAKSEKAFYAAREANVATAVLEKAKTAILAARAEQAAEALADVIAPNRAATGLRVVRPAELDVAAAEKAFYAAREAGVATPVLEKAKTAILLAKDARLASAA